MTLREEIQAALDLHDLSDGLGPPAAELVRLLRAAQATLSNEYPEMDVEILEATNAGREVRETAQGKRFYQMPVVLDAMAAVRLREQAGFEERVRKVLYTGNVVV